MIDINSINNKQKVTILFKVYKLLNIYCTSKFKMICLSPI